MSKGMMFFIIACAAAVTVTAGIIAVYGIGSGDGGDGDDIDTGSSDSPVGNFLQYSTSGPLRVYYGTLTMKITDINTETNELEYTVSFDVTVLGTPYRETVVAWMPMSDDPLTGIFLDELDPTGKTDRFRTIHGLWTMTDIYTGTFFEMDVTVYAGQSNKIIYRVVTPVEGMDIVWNLSAMKL